MGRDGASGSNLAARAPQETALRNVVSSAPNILPSGSKNGRYGTLHSLWEHDATKEDNEKEHRCNSAEVGQFYNCALLPSRDYPEAPTTATPPQQQPTTWVTTALGRPRRARGVTRSQ